MSIDTLNDSIIEPFRFELSGMRYLAGVYDLAIRNETFTVLDSEGRVFYQENASISFLVNVGVPQYVAKLIERFNKAMDALEDAADGPEGIHKVLEEYLHANVVVVDNRLAIK